MSKTKVQDPQRVEELLQLYAAQKQAKAEADKRMKELKSELEGIAERNSQWFEDKLTCTFEHGKIKYETKRNLVPGKKFDMAAFAADYPQLVKTDFVRGKVLSALADGLITADLKTDETHEFAVEVK